MTKAANINAIETATHMPWDEWVARLDAANARELPHATIASIAQSTLDGTIDNPGWWAQSIAVAYEQHIGRRLPGQLANGLFEVTTSKSITDTRSIAFERIADWLENQQSFDGLTYTNARRTTTPKRSNWRCDLKDGTRVTVTVEDSNTAARLVLTHTNLPAQKAARQWKAYWQTVAAALKEG